MERGSSAENYLIIANNQIELTERVDPATSGAGHITLKDPDGHSILIDQFQ